MNNNLPFSDQSALYLKLLLKRLLLSLALLVLARILFLGFNWAEFGRFPVQELSGSFFFGLRFDASALAYINLLAILLHILPLPQRRRSGYRAAMRWAFLIPNGLALALNLMDTGYYPFSKKRTGSEVWALKNEFGAVAADYLLDYWYLPLCFILLCWLMWRAYCLTEEQEKRQAPHTRLRWWSAPLLFLLTGGLWVLAARGGTQLRPVRPFDAAKHVSTDLLPLTINTPFQLIATIDKAGIEELTYFPEAELNHIYNPIHNYSRGQDFSKKNVVVILMESFGKEYIGYYRNDPATGKPRQTPAHGSYTPFLDSLLTVSLSCDNAFANGTRTLDALPSVLAGIPSLMDKHYAYSRYSANKNDGLGYLLSRQGYNTSFYHGGPNGTYNLDSFVAVAEAGKYYGLNEYPHPEDYDQAWGVYDSKYLPYFAEELSRKPQPFLSSVLTCSLHHPYVIAPDHAKALDTIPVELNRSIAYVDGSLRDFFKRVSTQPWYRNTLFVLVADHTSHSFEADYQTSIGKFAIPMLFFTPDGSLKGAVSKTTQQIDILPTVLDWLHYPKPFFSLGSSVTDSTYAGYSLQYFNNVYQLIQLPWLLKFDGKQTIALHNVAEDPSLQKNVLSEKRPEQAGMERQLKALLQHFTHGLIHNKLHSDGKPVTSGTGS